MVKYFAEALVRRAYGLHPPSSYFTFPLEDELKVVFANSLVQVDECEIDFKRSRDDEIVVYYSNTRAFIWMMSIGGSAREMQVKFLRNNGGGRRVFDFRLQGMSNVFLIRMETIHTSIPIPPTISLDKLYIRI
ncbi:hypothetical protein Gohar_003714 [Gossypium harknessii]|uniref:Uncharacterized protein n=1 Tax=Gossypium harknessii TaxID=34285 RepID=A0A7J9I889_9ROSI|nr:hypothetical protein [Gossypium harknessii]